MKCYVYNFIAYGHILLFDVYSRHFSASLSSDRSYLL